MRVTLSINEKQFESQVRDLAKLFKWKYYHTFLSKWSTSGFPDCVLVRPPRLIFAELKSENGKVSDEQQEWLDLLTECQNKPANFADAYRNKEPYVLIPEVYLWRPSQIEEIAEILR